MTSFQRTVPHARSLGGVRTVRLTVLEGDEADRGRSVQGPQLTVGTASGVDLALADPTVSRYHVELAAEPQGIAVRDLGSTNGTFVGGVRIERGLVPPGTVLQVGQSRIRLDDGERLAPEPREQPPSVDGLVAESPKMRRLVARLAKVARTDVTVLLQGETGTGKEVLAHAVHRLSPRAEGPFVVVDCGSLPATLVASELFGHEKGAFTGAERRHYGAFERAEGGTVFLDEIGELPLQVQPALLGVLERRRFRRVGGERDYPVDVRVVAATHRDLRAEVNQGRFRADLYYRLAVARLEVPALRERPEDIEPLVRHFVREATGSDEMPFSEATLEALRRHPWSGNVRELRNVVEAALAVGEAPRISTMPAPPVVQRSPGGFVLGADPEPWFDEEGQPMPYREARAMVLRDFERAYLGRLIEQCGGNASEAARRARMDRAYLLQLLRRHDLR